jgi:hypothetical protein
MKFRKKPIIIEAEQVALFAYRVSLRKITIIWLTVLGIGQIQASDIVEFVGAEWSNNPEQYATLVTTAFFEAHGKRRVWQCEDGREIPDCAFIEPPVNINPCGTWLGRFRVNYGVTCPPIWPRKMTYYMDQCDGGNVRVGSWKLHPQGTCEDGYADTNILLVFASPDCERGEERTCCQHVFECSTVNSGEHYRVGNIMRPLYGTLCPPQNTWGFGLQVDAVGGNGEVLAFTIVPGLGYTIPPNNPIGFGATGGQNFRADCTFR